jgi:DNA repair protein RadA/Sms
MSSIQNIKKQKIIYRCQNCGYSSSKWLGKCPECEKWNSFVEESIPGKDIIASHRLTQFSSEVYHLDDISITGTNRYMTDIVEFDRILGGGIMPGSLILLGGSPGIGKSTLMLQVAGALSKKVKLDNKNITVLYVSGEESPQQVKIRAERLNIRSVKSLYIISETNLETILETVKKILPDILIIDSIQTIYKPDISAIPGSIGQIRECSQELLYLAKGKGVTVFLLGHITKGGDIAGPMVLEHIVDTVLYFETEQNNMYRILRAHKNRFGPTSEIGIFEMKSDGLKEIRNPSEIFLNERTKKIPGSCVVTSLEGTRPLLIEVQALVTKTNFGLPRRMITGYDYNRAILLISVLEKRENLPLGIYDVFINIAGGIKINEPSIDLGICVSIYTAYLNKTFMQDTVFIGEVGLMGEVRNISFVKERINEIEKMGFKNVFLPESNFRGLDYKGKLKLYPVSNINEVTAKLKE